MTVSVTRLGIPCSIAKPYMVVVNHSLNGDFKYLEFRALVKRTKLYCANTWGYTTPLSRFDSKEFREIYRSYWVFSDKDDLVQFILSTNEYAIKTDMWPKKLLFVMFEYQETEH